MLRKLQYSAFICVKSSLYEVSWGRLREDENLGSRMAKVHLISIFSGNTDHASMASGLLTV